MQASKKALMAALVITMMTPALGMAKGTITFQGRIVSQMTYQATVNGSSHGVVQLPQTAELNTAGHTPFTVALQRGAQETGAVSTAFVGVHTTHDGNLKNVAQGVQGTQDTVQVRLLDHASGKPVAVHAAAPHVNAAAVHPDHAARTFAAQYVATNNNAHGTNPAGPVTAVVEYLVSYL